MFVDADTHVDECEETWSYWPNSMSDVRPAEMVFRDGQQPDYVGGADRPPRLGLFIDGRIFSRRVRSDEATSTTVGTRELYDVPGRVKDMDALGVDVQVIFPSTLLEEVTRRPEIEIALCESYNRWLADRCSSSGGHLQWNAMLPLRSTEAALREMRRVKQEGAIGIFKRGFECDDRRAGDVYFHPIYELAQELDLPICIHVSTPYTGTTPVFTRTDTQIRRGFWVQDAFLSIVEARIPSKFPRLKFGFIEAASGWLPHILWLTRFDRPDNRPGERERAIDDFTTMLENARLFVTCEAAEDLPDIVSRVGDTNLILGSDYSHSDRSALLKAHQLVMDRPDLETSTKEKITRSNAVAFYGLG